MSKRQSKTGVQHLVYQAKTGFQYYFTFPSYISNHPQLPAQIRWSLGHDEALARDLAQYLNPRFRRVSGFVWWSRGDLNPRPPALRYRFYMLSHLY